ncbi:MAG: hypothetical protein M1538_00740 [Candidatus Marsarchaeota archaeon]|jgi:hypothetical protein|nr:hypothetical protein [Candidatus Marsarchaeota archaeon]
MKNTISIDLNDTIANLTQLVNKLILKDMKLSKQDKELIENKTIYYGLTEEQMEEYRRKAWNNYNYYKIKLINSNIPRILKKLHKYYKITILTSTVAKDEQIKKWFLKNKITYNNLTHLNTQKQKAKYVSKIHIDDNCNLIHIFPKKSTLIVLSKPWNIKRLNELTSKYKNIIYMKNWKEIEDYLIKKPII